MAVFEMPLHEMGSYKGSNPRPTDFDAYWQAALAEIQAVHADILRAQMNDQEYACPPDAPRIFLQLRQLVDKLACAASGFHVFAMDCRGQGGLSEDPGGV